MGDNIVRRVPVAKLVRRHERRPTAEITEHQLHGLIRKHEDPHDDLEPELEVVDVLAEGTPSAPIMLPIAPAQRLAHTMRRGSQHSSMTAIPVLWSADDGPDECTIAMPRRERPDRRLIALPQFQRPASLAASQPMRPMRATGPATALEADPDTVRVPESFVALEPAQSASAPPQAEPDAAPGSDQPAPETAGPRLVDAPWHTRLVLPIELLVVLGAACLLIRAML
jgi:hypothetical protein